MTSLAPSSAFRIVPVEGRTSVLFQAIAPECGIHPGSLGAGVQVVLHWSRNDALNCMGTMLMLLKQPGFTRRDGFEGRETPPCVVAIKLGDEVAPPDAMCRVVVEAPLAEAYGDGRGIVSVELTTERAATLAERLMRRCGFGRVWLMEGGRVAWEDAPVNDPEGWP